MLPSLARQANNATNALHSLIYFSPENTDMLVGAGLEPGRMCYFAGRAAAMGAVGAGVVTATFYNFSPTLVAHTIPRAWALSSPAAVIEARFAAVDAAYTRLLGSELLASDDFAKVTELVRRACEACTSEGRPLYAGHADLAWPEGNHLVFWHAVTLLREYRGDGHIAALVAAGLSGVEAIVTHTATGRGFVPAFAQQSRGWSEPEWDDAIEGLVERGLAQSDGTLSTEGVALRSRIEEETDAMALAPWQHLGDEGTEEVIRIGRAMTAVARAAGAFPTEGVFAPARF